ncbi:acyl-CoA synthase [Plantactinospora sp. BC1]|uniref:SCP2 sterol-binding domain-containing protein n=1 Tax=Plantactinospora sp. BC1 TaxID=2108470 RepID=UPI000D1742B2|nr:SCP2 sterol-binding domain-containing protein [Plantactinospora sp. BC1]AVT32370.1 acyl-CoA synthase [Plantactinospora sp. BC1]
MPIEDLDPATLDARELALLVKATPTDELRALMCGSRRRAVLDTVVGRMPGVFRGDRAGGTSAVVHWRIGDGPDGAVDVYEIVIDGGACALSPEPQRQPKLTLTVGAVDFLRMVTGNAHPVTLAMKGKLKTKGDLGLTARFPQLFDIPRV